MLTLATAALVCSLAGCSGGQSTAADDAGAEGTDRLSGDVPDGAGDAEGDSHADADADDARDAPPPPWDVPPLADVAGCGNGVLEPGEECDDRNRLNGDGCDWLCRLGDGDPPPEPDPDVDPYAPSGDPIPIPDITPGTTSYDRMPLVWTGSEFATMLYERTPEDTVQVRFRRFDRAARSLDADWVFDAHRWREGLDLVWTGDGFGLFYAERDAGIYYQRLDRVGKPMGAAVLIEPDPIAITPAADVAPGGYVVAWYVDRPGGFCGGWSFPLGSTRLRLVGLDGSTSGPPVEVDSASGGPPDVATGDDGFGLAVSINSSPEHPACATRFAWVGSDLRTVVHSGILADGIWADSKWLDGRWVQGWWHNDSYAASTVEACAAWFTPGGALEGPPVCNDLGAISDGSSVCGPRVAAGDGGLALVGTAHGTQWLFFLRTDLAGRTVSGPTDVFEPYEEYGRTSYGAFNTVWAVDGFAVLFIADTRAGTELLYLQQFAAGRRSG